MSFIKHYVVGCEEECDYLSEEVRVRQDAIQPMWGIDIDSVFYDAVAPLVRSLLDDLWDMAPFYGVTVRPYKALCDYLGEEITNKPVREYRRLNRLPVVEDEF